MEGITLTLEVGLGLVVGVSLALTGSGGTGFAVPLLVYGLNLSPHRAVCVAMAAVGVTTALATVPKLCGTNTQIEVRTGLVLAIGGVLGGPAGAWLGRFLPERSLLAVFATVVLLVALRMLMGSRVAAAEARTLLEREPTDGSSRMSRSLSSPPRRYTLPLGAAGLASGVMAGLVGVGGGFILVPVLVLFGRAEIHRAVATSLAVTSVISVPATAAHLLAGQTIPLGIAAWFATGALLGFALGARIAGLFSPRRLQQLFGVSMLLMSVLMLLRIAR